MIVLITGATGGLGRVLSEFLVQRGVRVYGTSRSAAADRTAGGIPLLPMDVTDPLSVQGCVDELLQREGRIDVLINCVNEMVVGATDEQDTSEVEALYSTNVFGVMRVCKTLLPVFRRQGNGLIVNMSSLGGVLAVPFMGAYTSAKFALEAMSEALYHELRGENINVVIMQPVAMNMQRPATGAHLRTADGVAAASFSHKIVKMMARDTENSKLTPQRVAAEIYKVMQQPNPPLRVPLDRARVLGVVKRLAPQRVVNKLIDNLLKDAAAL